AGPGGNAKARRVRRGVRTGPRGYFARTATQDQVAALNSPWCSGWRGRHRCARVGLVDRGWTATAGVAIGGHIAAKRGPRGTRRRNRSAATPDRRAEERRQ